MMQFGREIQNDKIWGVPVDGMPFFQRERMPLTQTIPYDDFKGCNFRVLGLHEHCPIVPPAVYAIILHPIKKIFCGGLYTYFASNKENSLRGLYKISSCKSPHFAVKSGSFFEDLCYRPL